MEQPAKPVARANGQRNKARQIGFTTSGRRFAVEGEAPYPDPVQPGEMDRCSEGAKQPNTCGCGELRAADAVGPTLRFAGYDPDTDSWTGSALFVCKAGVSMAPELKWTDPGTGLSTSVAADCLDSFCDWNFWRFDLAIPVGDAQQRIEYEVEGRRAAFYIAGREQPYHWGYYSCNGFTPDVPRDVVEAKWCGLEPLWRDVIARHEAVPLHVMVGGGDQLYNDDVLRSPALQPFLEAPAEQRPSWAWSHEMLNDVEEYYFHHYATHFNFGLIGEALRSIPSVMTWDDHDIFDGWGSYPEALQLCAVFQGIFRAARRFFLLFQLHTTERLYRWHGIFGRRSYNQVVLLGTRVALALPDCRSQRTENQVLALDTHMTLIIKVDELPDTVTHLVVGTTVPVVYPHLLGGDAVLSFFARLNKVGCINSAFKSIGFHKMVFNEVEEPELLDDLRDHWSSPTHRDERRFLIEHLQMLAKIKNLRVSLISGDVHLATTGRLYTWPKPDDFGRDFRFMPQIVSSAIANAPPPDGLVGALHLLGKAGFTNKYTRNKMCKLFDADGKHRLLNRRNWCEVWELDRRGESSTAALMPGQPALPGALVFCLRVETFDVKTQTAADAEIRTYQTVAQVLEKPRSSAAAHRGGITHAQDVYGTHAWSNRFRMDADALRRKNAGLELAPDRAAPGGRRAGPGKGQRREPWRQHRAKQQAPAPGAPPVEHGSLDEGDKPPMDEGEEELRFFQRTGI